uniref:C2H2-type domain-containing protein n=1 Tax=Heliothis virescens TaxID=7102 RepID=A0A2A4JW29_HELVI
MEGEESNNNVEGPYPILFIPKVCTPLETNCEMSENVFIHVNISSPDTEGNDTVIYKGFCNVKVVDGNDINIRYSSPSNSSGNDNNNNLPVILAEANQISYPAYNDSQVWIDPMRSPYVYNRCESPPQETYTIHESHDNHITIEQHNTYVTQNVYSFNEAIRYSPVIDEPKVVKKTQENVQTSEGYNIYGEDEFECGVFLSQLSEEIIHDKEMRSRDERKFVGLKTDNEALKQLMSSDIQSVSRQQKTILFLGHDSESGQTVQNIAINDPSVECVEASDTEKEVTVDFPVNSNPRKKKYQCNKCKQLFDQLLAFKQHMVSSHRLSNLSELSAPELRAHASKTHFLFMCDLCPYASQTFAELKTHQEEHKNDSKSSKTSSESEFHPGLFEEISDVSVTEDNVVKEEVDDRFQNADSVIAKVISNKIFQNHPKRNKSQRRYNKTCEVCLKKFDRIGDLKRHLIEHVIRSTLAKNPINKFGVLNIRCEVCQEKVFTKVDRYKAHLREHAKLTIYKCTFCDKSFSDSSNFSKHKKIHGSTFFQCDMCQRKFNSKKMITQHMEYHNKNGPIKCQFCDKVFHFESMLNKHIKCSHTKLIMHKFWCRFCRSHFSSLKEKWDHEWLVHNVRKVIVDCLTCEVCLKKFDRIGDLKRHLIEHVIRSTLAKNPINKFGVLNIRCEVCQEKVFTKVDRYKAHLREHAKLTIYKCTFCDKSFSDSSNFSKHKKIHGSTFFQCDMCQRKFNSKKMITQHMEYHNKNGPIKCQFCDKVFHFESMLNKHIKCSHTKLIMHKFWCRFCRSHFSSLKEKWDHEWLVHNVRKVIVDCLVCGSRFRKYAELKRHCTEEHDTVIPPAKKLLRWKLKRKMKLLEGCT